MTAVYQILYSNRYSRSAMLGPFGPRGLWVYFYVRDKSKSSWETARSFPEGETHLSHVLHLFIFADRIFSCLKLLM